MNEEEKKKKIDQKMNKIVHALPLLSRRLIITHTDLHGLTTGAFLKKIIPDANVLSVFDRDRLLSSDPNTFALFGKKLAEILSVGSLPEIFVTDIPVNAKDPEGYLEALKQIRRRAEKLIWVDHHVTSLKFRGELEEVADEVIIVESGSSLEMFNALEKYAVIRPNVFERDISFILLKVLGAVGDRDIKVLPLLDTLGNADEIIKVANGFDVMIREMSEKNHLIIYTEFMKKLAFLPFFEELWYKARSLYSKVPKAKLSLKKGNVSASLQKLPSFWATKALERMALEEKTLYAVGFSRHFSEEHFIVRGITLWTKMEGKKLFGERPEVRAMVNKYGLKFYGHPAAPVIDGFKTVYEAQKFVKELFNAIS